MEKIMFTTSDDVKIVGDLYQAESSERGRWALLLHMMPATKESQISDTTCRIYPINIDDFDTSCRF